MLAVSWCELMEMFASLRYRCAEDDDADDSDSNDNDDEENDDDGTDDEDDTMATAAMFAAMGAVVGGTDNPRVYIF